MPVLVCLIVKRDTLIIPQKIFVKKIHILGHVDSQSDDELLQIQQSVMPLLLVSIVNQQTVSVP